MSVTPEQAHSDFKDKSSSTAEMLLHSSNPFVVIFKPSVILLCENCAACFFFKAQNNPPYPLRVGVTEENIGVILVYIFRLLAIVLAFCQQQNAVPVTCRPVHGEWLKPCGYPGSESCIC